MRPAEQESLLLRSIVALRRSGLSHGEALTQAATGLPQGPLRTRVEHARRSLSAGTPDHTDPLLASGVTPIAALEHAAHAIDAKLSADATRAMSQRYLTLILAGPLVLGAGLAWLTPGLEIDYSGAEHTSRFLRNTLSIILRFIGVPLALGIAVLIRRGGDRIAPGTGRIRQAGRLLELAAADEDPDSHLTEYSDRVYFTTRVTQTSTSQAAAELATVMVHEGEGRARMFHHLAPLAAALLGVLTLAPILIIIYSSLLSATEAM